MTRKWHMNIHWQSLCNSLTFWQFRIFLFRLCSDDEILITFITLGLLTIGQTTATSSIGCGRTLDYLRLGGTTVKLFSFSHRCVPNFMLWPRTDGTNKISWSICACLLLYCWHISPILSHWGMTIHLLSGWKLFQSSCFAHSFLS